MRRKGRRPVQLGDDNSVALGKRSMGEEDGHMDGTSLRMASLR